MNLYNIWTGNLVQPPAIEWSGAGAVFVYHMDWRASIMYGLCFLVIIHTAAIIWSSRKNRALKAKVVPLLSGILLLFAGNMAVPLFNGFPIDILSGVLNAGVMFYTLYSRHVFRMTLLVSRGNCYIIAMAVSALAFTMWPRPWTASSAGYTDAGSFQRHDCGYYDHAGHSADLYGGQGIFDRIFIKEEVSQTERLSEYTAIVSQSLRLTEILNALVNVIGNTLHTRKIYICIRDSQGNYPAVFSSSPLDDKNFSLAGSAPLINWLKSHDSCLLLKDFRRTVEYKSMWEEEKYQMEVLKIECILPLKDGNDLAGLVLLGAGRSGERCVPRDILRRTLYSLTPLNP